MFVLAAQLTFALLTQNPIEVHFDEAVSHIASSSLAGANGHIFPQFFEMDNPIFVAEMQALQPQTHRFPGGSVANGWNVSTGGMYINIRKSWETYNVRHPNGITLNDHVNLTSAIQGAKQHYVVNMFASPGIDGNGEVMNTPSQFQTEANRIQPLLANAKINGFNPAYIEFSNELYLPLYEYYDFDRTVEDYENRMNAFSPMLRALFPETPFAAVLGLGEKYRDKPAEASDTGGLDYWVLDSTLDFQAIVLHAYISGTNDINQYIEAGANSLEDVMTNWFVHTELGMAASFEYTEQMYPEKEVWMTEWGLLMPGFTDPAYEPIFRNMALTVLQAASMYIEMLKYDSLTLANHHGMVPMLNPIYDEDDNLLRFERTTHGDVVSHFNKLYASSPTVLSSSIEGIGNVTSPIVNPNGSGWGGNSVSSIAHAFVRTGEEYHFLAINRAPTLQEANLLLDEIGIERASLETTRFYTTQTLPDGIFAGTLDLLAPTTQDLILSEANDNVDLPAMGFVDVKIAYHDADVNNDWRIDVQDILSIIGTWGCIDCQEDIDGSGAVDVGDLLMVIKSW